MARFYFLTGDQNWLEYGAKWIARLPYSGGTEYKILELINFEDATGEPMQLRGDPYDYPNMYCGPHFDTEKGTAKYAVQITSIDPNWNAEDWPKKVERAMESMGLTKEQLAKMTPWNRQTAIIQAVTEYGEGDTDYIRYGNNAHKLLADAKRFVK